MSSIRTTVHESLPYIDTEPTPSERAAAQSLIDAELSSSTTQPQSTLPALPSPNFSPIIQSELSRIAAKEPLSAIDLSRYEALDPAEDLPSPENANLTTLAPLLARAHTTLTHLSHRSAHLSLLEAYGKNAWLVSNWQLEGLLAELERDLAATKAEIDIVTIQRRRIQDDIGGELKGLDETWRRGVGRVLETEVAAEALRQQVLERQRERGG
ncbi:Pre-mRNA-splicing factor SPF27 [Xylariaceae sp. FL0016]|nr:Pre-mRNA-splicing factor SPF27 [Xylariaceae sp. FL0016]